MMQVGEVLLVVVVVVVRGDGIDGFCKDSGGSAE